MQPEVYFGWMGGWVDGWMGGWVKYLVPRSAWRQVFRRSASSVHELDLAAVTLSVERDHIFPLSHQPINSLTPLFP